MTLTQKQMVSEADNFIKSVGLTDEILGLKTKQDKILYYHNYLNENNPFRGTMNFHAINFIKLAMLICNTEERQDQFADFWEKNNDADLENSVCLWKFRSKLLNDRTEQENQKYLYLMKYQIDMKDWDRLHITLQELYLDIVQDLAMDRIVGMIEQGLTAEDIFQWYKKNHGRAASITTFDVKYIKSRVA